jgi:hypothetical protein
MNAADPRCLRLSELSQCAYRLGLAFGDEAERAEDHARRLAYFQLFDRCFFAVRVATALELRLARAPETSDEASTDREDRRERDRDDDRDRDREREVEPASLPVLLRTLDTIAADASALPGPEPAALPTLRELLAGLGSPTALPALDLRARLSGSAAAAIVTRPAPMPRGSALSSPVSSPIRRATGPPRR